MSHGGPFGIPTRTYSALARILRLAGTDGLAGMQPEIVPVQDLSRMLQAERVKEVMYLSGSTVVSTQYRAVDWNDASEWSTVSVNGVITTADDDLPQPTDDRIVVTVGLAIGGTQSNYTSASMTRILAIGGGGESELAAFGSVVTSHTCAHMVAPTVLPQRISTGELQCHFIEVVSGAVPITWMVQMLSAEPGVMAALPGV